MHGREVHLPPRGCVVRILTVRQPWAWAIIHGGKDVENRVRNIAGNYRGPVAIHVGMRPEPPGAPWSVASQAGMDTDRFDGDALHLGHIIGVVDLVDVHSASVIGGCGRMDNHCPEHPNGCRHHCSPWAMGPAPDGWYLHLELANPRPLSEPIPFKGALGLRRLDEATIARIEAQL